MKKTFIMSGILLLMCMQVLADSPRPYKLRVLTFEDNDAKEGFRALAYDEDEGDYLYRRQNIYFFDQGYEADAEGDIDYHYDMYYFDNYGETPIPYSNPWSKLISPHQLPENYNSPMLYCDASHDGELTYYWYDGGNTFLYSQMIGSTGMWAGHAISHYWGNDIDNQVSSSYDNQLAVYHEDAYNTEGTSGGGHNGSNNFCVHFGYVDNGAGNASQLPAFKFKDGVARVIDHMYVTPTIYSYCAYVADDPLGLTQPAYPDDKIYIEAFGFKDETEVATGNPTAGPVKFYLADGASNIVTDWTKWDLSELGEVVQVGFNMGGSDFAYSYGWFVFPAYFAYDDVAVRFERYKYERTGLTAGNYGTICLPRNVAANDYEGAVFYKVVGRTADWITLEEVTELEAGKAYIFQATAETLRAYSDDDEDRVSEPLAADANNVLQGCFTDNTVIPAGNWFLLSNVLYEANGTNNYVDNNRAYLTDITPATSTPAPGRRRVQLPIQQAPTALSETESQAAQAQKVMQNGVIYIKQNGYLYNIQGQIAK